LVRQLFACASAFSRSVVEGFSKASRTIVEGLSNKSRTAVEQLSKKYRESCVCTHAKVPARSRLGLALGMMLLLVQMTWFLEAQRQMENDTGTAIIEHHEYRLPAVTTEKLNDSMEMARTPRFVPNAT